MLITPPAASAGATRLYDAISLVSNWMKKPERPESSGPTDCRSRNSHGKGSARRLSGGLSNQATSECKLRVIRVCAMPNCRSQFLGVDAGSGSIKESSIKYAVSLLVEEPFQVIRRPGARSDGAGHQLPVSDTIGPRSTGCTGRVSGQSFCRAKCVRVVW